MSPFQGFGGLTISLSTFLASSTLTGPHPTELCALQSNMGFILSVLGSHWQIQSRGGLWAELCQSVVHTQAASALPGNLLEMQMLGLSHIY